MWVWVKECRQMGWWLDQRILVVFSNLFTLSFCDSAERGRVKRHSSVAPHSSSQLSVHNRSPGNLTKNLCYWGPCSLSCRHPSRTVPVPKGRLKQPTHNCESSRGKQQNASPRVSSYFYFLFFNTSFLPKLHEDDTAMRRRGLLLTPFLSRNHPSERLHSQVWKKPFYPHKALLLPHARTLILAFVLAVSRRPQLISFCSHWVRAQASQEHNCLETSMFLQLDMQEGFSHTLWFWDMGQRRRLCRFSSYSINSTSLEESSPSAQPVSHLGTRAVYCIY